VAALGNDSAIVVAIASERGRSVAPIGEAIVNQRGLVERAREGDHDAFAVVAGAALARLDAAARLRDGCTSWEWSPDGESILMVPGSGDILVVNARTGESITTPWSVAAPIDWQRVAP
jgi:hypothetical protein